MAFHVKDIMTTSVVAVSPNASLDEVLELLLRHAVSGLPVVDEQRRLVGVISERDLLGLLYDATPGSSTIEEYVSTNVVALEEDESLTDAADLFLSRPFRRLPVVRDDKLVGVISRRDLIRYIHQCRIRLAEQLPAVATAGA